VEEKKCARGLRRKDPHKSDQFSATLAWHPHIAILLVYQLMLWPRNHYGTTCEHYTTYSGYCEPRALCTYWQPENPFKPTEERLRNNQKIISATDLFLSTSRQTDIVLHLKLLLHAAATKSHPKTPYTPISLYSNVCGFRLCEENDVFLSLCLHTQPFLVNLCEPKARQGYTSKLLSCRRF
jgi:hypothetical protein